MRARLREEDVKKKKRLPLVGAEELPGLKILLDDPGFRSTDNGKLLLRIFSTHSAIAENGVEIARAIPKCYSKPLTDAARAFGQAWQEFADCLDLVNNEEPDEIGS